MKNPLGLQHLLSIKQLDRDTIHLILETATHLQNALVNRQRVPNLHGKLVANLFFEPSTRTCNSFAIAAQRLGALILTPNLQTSALLKGESLLDTVHNLSEMGVDAFIIRHAESGILSWLADNFKGRSHIISAGEGWIQHPTQALLDLMTIQQHKPNWELLRIAIIGDLRHSRVARSLLDGLTTMGVSDIRLVCPEALQPEADIYTKARLFNTVEEGIRSADVIVCLRLQKERMDQEHLINEEEFHHSFGITTENIQAAQADVIVMHPGPINRNIEITSEVADGPRSVILNQVSNGVAIRMAILKLFLG